MNEKIDIPGVQEEVLADRGVESPFMHNISCSLSEISIDQLDLAGPPGLIEPWFEGTV
jgi:hypothetical protein